MAENPARTRWQYRALFVCIAASIVFVQLLPLHPGPGRMPGPDVLLLVAIAWVLRRPDVVPVPLIAAVFLMADILFMRPPGLWTALVVLGLEFLRSRSGAARDWSLLIEWLVVAATVAIMFVANALVLFVFMVDQPGLGLTLIQLLGTILVYPIVVALAARAFGLRRPIAGDGDGIGARS